MLILCAFLCLVGGCATLPPPRVGLPPTATPRFASAPASLGVEPPEDALPHLVLLERQASLERNLALLAQLWAEDGRIVDGRGTADPADDYLWEGRAAILDRYAVAVFVNPPPPLARLDDFPIRVTGDSATAHHGQDRWRFVKRAGRWWLAELRYSTP